MACVTGALGDCEETVLRSSQEAGCGGRGERMLGISWCLVRMALTLQVKQAKRQRPS